MAKRYCGAMRLICIDMRFVTLLLRAGVILTHDGDMISFRPLLSDKLR